jgi:hypothetical protein
MSLKFLDLIRPLPKNDSYLFCFEKKIFNFRQILNLNEIKISKKWLIFKRKIKFMNKKREKKYSGDRRHFVHF